MEQKDFVMAMVDKILDRATTLRYTSTKSTHENMADINAYQPICKRNRRVDHNPPHITTEQLEGPTYDHFMTLSENRSIYKYCRYQMVFSRGNSETGTSPG